MKNIHILPTDKPSRLIIYSTLLNEFRLLDEPIDDWKHKRHIYITSNEDPKNKDYYWDENKLKVKRYFESRESFPSLLHRFKVILTTDPELIADGVQAIDDEFIQWFVKNPSCEWVEVGYGWIRLTETDNEGYWVSIPDKQFEMQQEEPKQETLEEDEIIDISDHDGIGNTVDNLNNEPPQKTLEEAANNWIKSTSEFLSVKNGFIAGAKLQAERMYSDEEVLEHLNRLIMMPSSKLDEFTDDEEMLTMKWFEQFKK
jgi:hypothetical protein